MHDWNMHSTARTGVGSGRGLEIATALAAKGAATLAAGKILEISEQMPAPIRISLGQEAGGIPQMARKKTDHEIRLGLLGLDGRLAT